MAGISRAQLLLLVVATAGAIQGIVADPAYHGPSYSGSAPVYDAPSVYVAPPPTKVIEKKVYIEAPPPPPKIIEKPVYVEVKSHPHPRPSYDSYESHDSYYSPPAQPSYDSYDAPNPPPTQPTYLPPIEDPVPIQPTYEPAPHAEYVSHPPAYAPSYNSYSASSY